MSSYEHVMDTIAPWTSLWWAISQSNTLEPHANKLVHPCSSVVFESLTSKTACSKPPNERGGASKSQSALHMHVLVCICSNVRQFRITGMVHVRYHAIVCT